MARPSQQDIAMQMTYNLRRGNAHRAVTSGRCTVEQAAVQYGIKEDTIRADIEHSRRIKEEFGEEPF